jgi:integrase
MRPDSVYQVLRRAGVEDQVWNTHSLRHNFATHFCRIQRDTKSLSLILGHSSQKITEDIYVHAVPEDLLSAHTSVFTTGHVRLTIPLS